MHFRGLSFRECWRFSKEPFKFSIAIILKAIDFKGPNQWLPAHEGEMECAETDLSDNARQHLMPNVMAARALGYRRGRFGCIAHNLDPHTKEGFSYCALHDDGIRAIFIGAVQSDSSGTLKTTVASTGLLALGAGTSVTFVNHNNYFDGCAEARTVAVRRKGIDAIDEAMKDYLHAHQADARIFAGYDEMKRYTESSDVANWDTRVARGLFRPMVAEPTDGAGTQLQPTGSHGKLQRETPG